MTASKIEWCDRSDWNPIRGCTRSSEGCRNCYAERIAARFSVPGQPFHGIAERAKSGPSWTGKVELIEERLTLPLRWRKPARIFVNSMFDLFHEAVPDDWIDRVFAVMALAPQHTFLLLTKRAARMRRWLTIQHDPNIWRIHLRFASGMPDGLRADNPFAWPLQNVWLGASVEDQARADERIPELLATPAAKHFISAEPLLGPIDLTRIRKPEGEKNALTGDLWIPGCGSVSSRTVSGPRLDWVIVGGESGPGARPMHPDWARSLRDQCAAAGVPFFFKQWGEWLPTDQDDGQISYGRDKSHGWNIDRPDETWTYRVGKRAAGRLLDGREHNGVPA